MTERCDAWTPQRGDLAHDGRSGRTGVVVSLPEDTGTDTYHLCDFGGGDEWSVLRAHLVQPDEAHGTLLLSDRLTNWAQDRDIGERAAVAALIEEGDILARGDVRDLLIVESGTVVFCDWPRFEAQYRCALVLDEGEDAFLTLVLATAFPRLVPLWKVEVLGDRRLGIVLRALACLGGSTAIAVGTRS
ncbi:hypothetical protein ACFWPV_11350 [Streptomyces uncialis]|uniref:hypothetical protein n=1 Tax=Streptomyces uncialis TaxID=1048205 RepID=UPI00364B86E9